MASRYRKIDPRIWTDEKFRQLTGEEQRIALYVLTAQSNRIGLFSFSPGKACEDLSASPQAFRRAFETVCRVLKWEWDPEARVLYLPTWWKYNPPESVNNLVGNLKDLDDLPATPLLKRFAANTVYLSDSVKQTFAQAFTKGYPHPSPSPSPQASPTQEQKQEQEQDSPLSPQGAARTDGADGNGANGAVLEPEDLVKTWNSIAGVKRVQNLIPRQGVHRRLLVRLKDHPDQAWWDRLFDTVRASDWLCGRTNGRSGPFHVTLEWALGPENLTKILQGDYATAPKKPGKTYGDDFWHPKLVT